MSTVIIKSKADFKEVDGTMRRLMASIHPKPVNKLAAETAWHQVKTKYGARFSAQVNVDSPWQQVKRQVAHDLPLGPAPGFLTGTTFSNIVTEASESMGLVNLSGKWPAGTGRAMMDVMSEAQYGFDRGEGARVNPGGVGFKWCDGMLEVNLGGSSFYIKGKDSIADEKYGPAGSEIEWMYLDPEDVGLIVRNLQKHIVAVTDKKGAALKDLHKSTEYEDTIGGESLETAKAKYEEALTGKPVETATVAVVDTDRELAMLIQQSLHDYEGSR